MYTSGTARSAHADGGRQAAAGRAQQTGHIKVKLWVTRAGRKLQGAAPGSLGVLHTLPILGLHKGRIQPAAQGVAQQQGPAAPDGVSQSRSG